MEDMICDIGQDSFQQVHMFDSLKDDSKTSLYPAFESLTRLSAVIKLINIKPRNEWTNKSFNELLELLHEMLPKDNTLSTRHYGAKKILCLMGMKYQKIHACPKGCILYRKEFESLHKCPRCKVSRYKDDDNEDDYLKKRILLQKHYGIFQSFRNLNVCLLMLMTQKTSLGMQMEKNLMDCYDILSVHRNGRKLIFVS